MLENEKLPITEFDELRVLARIAFKGKLRTIHKIVYQFLKASKRRINNKFKKFPRPIDKIQATFSIYSEAEDQQTVARSFFILTYSYFENYLNTLCSLYITSFPETTLSVKDISGKGIERAKTYLEKVAKLEPMTTNSEWEKLLALNAVRNKIVHAGSLSDNDLKKKISKFYDNRTIKINERDEINISIKFVMNFVEELSIILFKTKLIPSNKKLAKKKIRTK
ncbi:hypothetical protein [Leptospira alstonii]|uniref:hypothetical protein n=1 Tax=Leptospira alstonii TaxID=28452 RepID=UPI0007747439|nr:hypothetical protein [Leptospira alstonii]